MFLEVKSHDNDFHFDFVDSLTEIWHLINDRHINKFAPDKRLTALVFKDVLNKEVILPVLLRLVALSAVKRSILWEVSGAAANYGSFKQPKWVPGGVAFHTVDYYIEYFKDVSSQRPLLNQRFRRGLQKPTLTSLSLN